MNKKILTLIFGMIFLITILGSVSATSIGTFKQDQDVELYQTCNNCTYCNFTTIKYPNSTNIFTDISANESGSFYSYILDGNYTTEIGTYSYTYDCGNSEESATGKLTFEINPSGNETTSFSGLIYGIVFLFILILFILVLYFANKLPWKNGRGEDGGVTSINKTKYWKIFLYFISYLLALFLFGIGREISENYIYLDMARTFFGIGWNILLIGLVPCLIAVVSIGIITALADKRISNALTRRVKVR